MKVFTTTRAAELTGVSVRTVTKWCDTGRLKHYRIPGSMARRIPAEYLARFLREHGMPVPVELEDQH